MVYISYVINVVSANKSCLGVINFNWNPIYIVVLRLTIILYNMVYNVNVINVSLSRVPIYCVSQCNSSVDNIIT